jgi:hypothetical protein
MECAKLSIEDYTRSVVIAAKLHTMAKCPVLFARNAAKLAATIRYVVSSVMSLVYRMLTIVYSLAHIADGVRYRV